MDSASDVLSAFALRIALVSAALIVGLLVFILLRRFYRGRLFASLDEQSFSVRQHWNDIVSYRIPVKDWYHKPVARTLIEQTALDRIADAGDERRAELQRFLRHTGLVQRRIFEARFGARHKRHEAVLALGRSRLPEAIPVLSEVLQDTDHLLQDAAMRALGHMETPAAGVAIMDAIEVAEIQVSQFTVKDALLRTCRSQPQLLTRYLDDETTRLLVARILGEIANGSVADELAVLAADPDPEIRASAARGLAYVEPLFAVSVLSELVMDEVWFVRLRAVVSLAGFNHPATMGALLASICDTHRSVRQRSAAALVQLKPLLPMILDRISVSEDKYALHAFISELERSGECHDLMLRLNDKEALVHEDGRWLMAAVEKARRQIAEAAAGVKPKPEDPLPQFAAADDSVPLLPLGELEKLMREIEEQPVLHNG
jgi:hypothetical protein